MARFKVSMQEQSYYSVEVEAENEEAAREAAKAAWDAGEASFDGCDEFAITDVEPADTAAEGDA